MTDFIVVGNMNACTYKEVFPLFKSGKARLGYVANRALLCKLPEGSEDEYAKVNSVSWFVTFPVEKEPLVLSKTYNPEDYPKYDNYDAINVDRVENIPYDYDGVMGVPVSFLAKCGGGFVIEDKLNSPVIGGERIYKRVIVKKNLK